MSAGILKAVKELLDPVAEYLHEQEPKPSFIAFGMYMIGRDEARSNPTLLISCERKTPRQKAVKLIRESTILKETPGVRLAESPRPPLCAVSPIPLRLLDDEAEKGSYKIRPAERLYWQPTEATCGISLYTKRIQGNELVYKQISTVGGIVSLDSELFGLCTAHGFVEDSEARPLALPDDEMEYEISFDDWIEGDDIPQEAADPHEEGVSTCRHQKKSW
jgi:hypothetical protein